MIRGIVAGVIGGLVGSWTMNRFQATWSRVVDGHVSQSAGGSEDARDWQERGEGTNATELAAQAIATRTIDRELTRDELAIAAPLVHYAFGAAMGGLYGALAEVSCRVRQIGGTGFGTAVWVGGDELAVPALGLSKPNAEYPVEVHAQAFASHLVYGATLEAVRKGVRAAITR